MTQEYHSPTNDTSLEKCSDEEAKLTVTQLARRLHIGAAVVRAVMNQPLLMIAGSVADTRCTTENAYAKALLRLANSCSLLKVRRAFVSTLCQSTLTKLWQLQASSSPSSWPTRLVLFSGSDLANDTRKHRAS